MRRLMGILWRWMRRTRREGVGGIVASQSVRIPNGVNWSRFIGVGRTIETTRTIIGELRQVETTRTIRERPIVREIEPIDIRELRQVETTLLNLHRQLEDSIRAIS